MDSFSRRDFIGKSIAAAGLLGGLGGTLRGETRPAGTLAVATRPASGRLHARDTVILGKTGIKTSRLSMGTGTKGGREQRALGEEGFVRLLRYGLDEGVRWWDAADAYQTHPHLRTALKEISRDRVVITSKTRAKDGAAASADIERFRRELGTDYIDIVLLHCMTDGDWPNKMRSAMDALSEAKEKGQIGAVGCSCHSLAALQAAADEPWVDVTLARINPFAKVMDVDQPEDVPKVVRVLETMHNRGKAVYGMKILGEGALQGEQIDQSLRFVLGLPFISGFTIGFSSQEQVDDIARRIERASTARDADLGGVRSRG